MKRKIQLFKPHKIKKKIQNNNNNKIKIKIKKMIKKMMVRALNFKILHEMSLRISPGV